MLSEIGELDSEQLSSRFQKDGYLVVPNFLTEDDRNLLKSAASRLVDGFTESHHTIFTTNEQERSSDEYFLSSGNVIRFFFEDGVFDENGQLTVPKELAINKIGHAMHALDPDFRQISTSDKIRSILRNVLKFDSPTIVQSMYIFKQPFRGGEVTPHQDSSFLYTEPPSVVGLWMALEDATLENGCLWGCSGSHLQGIPRRFLLTEERKTVFEPPGSYEYDTSNAEPLEVPAGTLVVLHGSFVHFSHVNKSDRSRQAFTLHVVEGNAEWSQQNWMQQRDHFLSLD